MESLSTELAAYRSQLQRIFVYYCCFGDKDNHSLLKIQNYHRLLSDLQLLAQPALASHYDVIFYAAASPATALPFTSFAQALIPISGLAFGETHEKPLERLLSIHVQPLHDYILGCTEFGRSLGLISGEHLREHSYRFLSLFEEGLFAVYSWYFRREGKGGLEEEVRVFSRMSRELNLCPRAVSKPTNHLLFLFLTDRLSKTAFHQLFAPAHLTPTQYKFDFLNFLDFLIIVAQISSPAELSDQLKIYGLLEAVEISQGCQQLASSTKFQHFYLSAQQLEQACQPKLHLYTAAQSRRHTGGPPQLDSATKRRLGEHYDILKSQFIRICSKKQVESNFYMDAATARQLFLALCPKLTPSAVQALLTSVDRLNFQHFVQLLERLSQNIRLPVEKLYEQVSLYEAGQLRVAAVLANMRLEQLEEAQCKQVLRMSQPYLMGLFDFYQNNGYLSCQAYLRLLQDTSLVPKILTVEQAADIFSACSMEKGKMGFGELEMSLLGMVVGVSFQHELQGVQRLLYLLERICESKRGQLMMKKNVLSVKQHPLYKLRVAFQPTYNNIQLKLTQNPTP